MAWATVADVLDKTGVNVSTTDLSFAQSIIEVFADIDPDATDTGLTARDQHKLKMATVFQAAWLDGQVAVVSRMDISQLSQDGLSASYQGAEGQFLAPLAKRCLDRLSWNASRIIGRDRSGYSSFDAWEAAFLRDDADGGAPWQPMKGL